MAGHLDGGESGRAAMVREAKEEAGVVLASGDLEHILTMHRRAEDGERMDLFFTARTWAGEIRNMESHKCDDLSWFSLGNLPGNMVPYIQAAIVAYREGIKYVEFGWKY